MYNTLVSYCKFSILPSNGLAIFNSFIIISITKLFSILLIHVHHKNIQGLIDAINWLRCTCSYNDYLQLHVQGPFLSLCSCCANPIDWIKFDFSTAVAWHLKPSHASTIQPVPQTLVKSFCETALKPLIWAPTCVPRFQQPP